MRKIITSLWFDDQAEEAANFYTSIFDDSEILAISRCTAAGPGPEGSVLTVRFQLQGQEFLALNGGPVFTFSEAISLIVSCESQAEVDRYWDALLEGGAPSQCGWLKDKYGLSWQIVPVELDEMMADPDTEAARRVTEAMLTMVKLDLGALRAAHSG